MPHHHHSFMLGYHLGTRVLDSRHRQTRANKSMQRKINNTVAEQAADPGKAHFTKLFRTSAPAVLRVAAIGIGFRRRRGHRRNGANMYHMYMWRVSVVCRHDCDSSPFFTTLQDFEYGLRPMGGLRKECTARAAQPILQYMH